MNAIEVRRKSCHKLFAFKESIFYNLEGQVEIKDNL